MLPEEDNDDFVIRKISFKSHQTHKCNGFKLKTHSVDDVYKFRPTQPSFLKETSSCKNIISDKTGSVDFCPCDYRSYFQNDVDISTKENAIANKSPGNESERSFFFPAEGFGQPLSLDYSDTESCQIGHTPWMISNPERNETIVLPTVRRGSYKKSRSTCRPLRLPCAKDDKVCKVRFDLSEHSPKNESVTKSNNEKHHSSLKVNKNIRTVSRFRVEIVDELEFRKSIENDNAAVTKNKSLASSVLCTQSVENGLLPLGLKNHTTFSGSPILRSTNGSISQVSSIENADISRVKNEKSLNEICLLKRQKQSDSYSNNERNPNCNDVLFKSIKLHTNGEWIVMKDIKLESLDPPHSVSDFDIPYIDAEDMPVLKPNAELFNATSIFSAEEAIPNSSPTSPAGNSENIYLTPSNLSPVLNGNEFFNFNSSKYCGLSKSPTVLKNLSNFEIFSEIFDSASIQKLVRDKNLQEDEDEDFKKDKMDPNICHTGGSEGSSVDISEASGSDTLTYGTVRSNFLPSSDCDSDTYVTIWSERSSLLDRKFSDLSENSSPSYNTPPETFSGGFCTPPDNYSPILNLLKDSASSNSSISFKTIGESSVEGRAEDVSQCICVSNKSNNFKSLSLNFKEPPKKGEDYVKLGIFFDSSKRGFHEKSDVKENLEITLLEGDGLPDLNFKGLHRSEIIKKKLLRTGEFHEISQYERNSFRSFSEFSLAELGKQQSVLPKENSADEYNFLEPHDSCLNLSEEISSPSTTPDTSNKTVIFKNVALTVSNAIDLEDEDDYFTSKTEKQVNLGDSSLETLDTPATVERTDEIRTCREDSSICSSSITIPKLRASFPNETLTDSPFNSVVLASASPNSMASSLTSDSENSNSAIHSSSFANFVGSEFHLSNVDLLSVHSDNCGSLSHRSNIITCDSVFISDTEKSTAISISRISRNLCSHASNNILPTEKSSDDLSEELSLPSLADTSNEDDLELSDINNVVHVSGLKIPSSAVEGASN